MCWRFAIVLRVAPLVRPHLRELIGLSAQAPTKQPIVSISGCTLLEVLLEFDERELRFVHFEDFSNVLVVFHGAFLFFLSLTLLQTLQIRHLGFLELLHTFG